MATLNSGGERGWSVLGGFWEPMKSGCAAFIMPISATPITHLISQTTKTEST